MAHVCCSRGAEAKGWPPQTGFHGRDLLAWRSRTCNIFPYPDHLLSHILLETFRHPLSPRFGRFKHETGLSFHFTEGKYGVLKSTFGRCRPRRSRLSSSSTGHRHRCRPPPAHDVHGTLDSAALVMMAPTLLNHVWKTCQTRSSLCVGSTRNVDANRAPDLVQPFDNIVRGVAARPTFNGLMVDVPGISSIIVLTCSHDLSGCRSGLHFRISSLPVPFTAHALAPRPVPVDAASTDAS